MKAKLPSNIGALKAKPPSAVTTPASQSKPAVSVGAKLKVDGGVPEVVTDTKTVNGKSVPAVSPLPVYKLAGLIAPTQPKIFLDDSQLAARFNQLADQLEAESGCQGGAWAGSLMVIHSKIKADPELCTTLTGDALTLYFRACSKLANTSAGVALTKKLAAKRQEDSAAKQQKLLLDIAQQEADIDEGFDLEF